MIQEAELLLHKVESASKSCGLFLNPSKATYMHINPTANDSVHSSDGSQTEKVEDFKYPTRTHNMTSCVETPRHGRQFTPLTKFGECPYQTEDFQDDFRTDPDIWLRFMVANTNNRTCTGWHLHKNAAEKSKRVIAQSRNQPRTVRLPTTDHHYSETTASSSDRSCDVVANKVLLWKLDGPRRRGRPTITLQNILEKDRTSAGLIDLLEW